MIKIKRTDLSIFAKEHYLNIAEFRGVSGRAENIISLIEGKIKTSRKRNREFYTRLLEYISDKDDNLIIATPEDLSEYINKIELDFSDVLQKKDFRKNLLNIFYYNSYDKWDAYQLAGKLEVKVCPYCNRQFTFTVGNSKRKGTRPQFDHFFDKATYPYLALSFYNLIPSCSICNSDIKGSIPFTIIDNIHPYINCFEDTVRFTIIPKNISFLQGKPSAFNVRWRLNKSNHPTKDEARQILNHLKIFRFKDLYNQHKDYVSEIIQKSVAYNSDYYENLFNQFNGTLFTSIDDVKKMVLSNYITIADLGERPLAKLTRDIADELGIL